jgi:hypothetical protein
VKEITAGVSGFASRGATSARDRVYAPVVRWYLGLSVVAAGCASGRTTPDGAPPPPVIDHATVSISPAMPRTADDLQAMVSDPSRSDYGFGWSVDGAPRADLVGSTVPASATTKGQHWQVELLGDGAVVSSSTVTILNTPPEAPTISVPASPPLAAPIQCKVDTPARDADADAITYAASWTKNGAAFAAASQTMFAGDTVPGAEVKTAGDSFVCTVTASDGEATVMVTSSAAVVVDPCAGKSPPAATSFSYTGGNQTYTVPACVTTVTLEVWGAQGAGGMGGKGGYARGDVAVTPGQVLTVMVGGQGGWNGGGAATGWKNANGGGASDVRTGAAPATRLIVAGGGGGGGGSETDVCHGNAVIVFAGGAGGGGDCGANYCGGAGGDGFVFYDKTQSCKLVDGGPGAKGGNAGGVGMNAKLGGGGGGGGFTSGGGGSCETLTAPATQCAHGGTVATGGDGDASTNGNRAVCYQDPYAGTAGGGGGYYGGGGTAIGQCGGGAGGGGSSYVGSLVSPSMQAAAQTGDGKALITPK